MLSYHAWVDFGLTFNLLQKVTMFIHSRCAKSARQSEVGNETNEEYTKKQQQQLLITRVLTVIKSNTKR